MDLEPGFLEKVVILEVRHISVAAADADAEVVEDPGAAVFLASQVVPVNLAFQAQSLPAQFGDIAHRKLFADAGGFPPFPGDPQVLLEVLRIPFELETLLDRVGEPERFPEQTVVQGMVTVDSAGGDFPAGKSTVVESDDRIGLGNPVAVPKRMLQEGAALDVQLFIEMVFEKGLEDISDEGFPFGNRIDSSPFQIVGEGLVVDLELERRACLGGQGTDEQESRQPKREHDPGFFSGKPGVCGGF